MNPCTLLSTILPFFLGTKLWSLWVCCCWGWVSSFGKFITPTANSYSLYPLIRQLLKASSSQGIISSNSDHPTSITTPRLSSQPCLAICIRLPKLELLARTKPKVAQVRPQLVQFIGFSLDKSVLDRVPSLGDRDADFVFAVTRVKGIGNRVHSTPTRDSIQLPRDPGNMVHQ